jgi:PAS domain S-box-containing protein
MMDRGKTVAKCRDTVGAVNSSADGCLSEIKEKQKTLISIVDFSPNGIIAVNPQNRIIIFNNAAEKILGIKKENALGRLIKELFPEIDLSEQWEGGSVANNCHYVLNGKDLHARQFPIQTNGAIESVVIIMQEISEVIELAQKLEDSQKMVEEFQAILEASFDGILVTDGKGKVLMLNKAYERLTGLSATEMLGGNMRDFLNPQYMPNSVALMVLDEKKPVTIPHQTKNGRSIMVTGSPVFNEQGEIVRVVTNVRDISEIYELRQELIKAQEMEKLYYQQLGSEWSKGKDKGPVAVSTVMKNIFALASKVSSVDATVLILGDSGVGKEVVAKYIHENSPRNEGPFITINCGAIPEQLLESELFGYAPGAFTGAIKNGKAGLFEMAQGGTLFLDEIGELPLNLQVKILRALETREIIRVGSCKSIPIDVRILAATNRNLEEMVKKNEFREDLFYRLNVIQIKIPPLRERVEDIAPLSIYFLNLFNARYGQKKRITYDVIKELERYHWPGNIRELKNVIERMVIVSSGEFLQIGDLPWYDKSTEDKPINSINISGVIPIAEAIEEMEKQILQNAIKEYKTSRKIAKAIGVDQSTVIRKIKKYGLKTDGGGD